MLSLLLMGAVGVYAAKNKIRKDNIENEIEEFFLKMKDKHIMFLLNDEGGHYKKENDNTIIIKGLSDSLKHGCYGCEYDFSDEKESWKRVSEYVLEQVKIRYPAYNHIYHKGSIKHSSCYKDNKYVIDVSSGSKEIVVHNGKKFFITAKVVFMPADGWYLSMTYFLDQIKIIRR